MNNYDAVIIGAGACGLMCAAQAGLLGKKTLLIERNEKPGAKILISGGGRCNYTNIHTSVDNFVSENSKFLNAVFSQWTVDDTLNFFEQYGGITGQEKTLGQLFPVSNKAKDIVATFSSLLYDTGQDLWLNTEVKQVHKLAEGFEIVVDRGGSSQTIVAKKVVMASGGLPVAKLGASDFALRVAKQFDIHVVPTAAALVPLTITGKDADWYASLAGNSVFARVYNDKIAFEENILFTHWGLSGPAILQISSYWKAGEQFTIDLLPKFKLEDVIKQERNEGGKRTVGQLLNDYFTRKMVEALGKYLPLDIKIASLSKVDAKLIVDVVHRFKVKPAGDKGYDKAEVMRGGVSTEELHAKNLESKKISGLYFGGEAVDITGWLGGYNFQWAWAAGFVIAQDL
ncbi:aminoacetone oxidase family FAD-binding enzyme [Sphingobacterium sp. DK4209]|uniref:Aminoacetone oxidase family FAD-binding enzyme n=1 Tax=Sphingobacterium zhuxiongii TaxID=2662364 RepID=A0A5Q0Q9M6_9SPHI|nr:MULTISPECIES: aminoacetone oxidase family FAD-binding enzyme [unclassified Sphingobacterium]MVZ64508.1 aminoacetone oxidase family FAD-binding enzyme [Sphingobacterium sp. DK4209]QGA25839.1 aminoacetone oxidase family FAD-binding enzyme [Sphingobacterium sp. dk4302]